MSDALEWLRDGLRQAAVHSHLPTMRMVAEAALYDPSPMHLAAIGQVDGCIYAPRLRTLIADYKMEGTRT